MRCVILSQWSDLRWGVMWWNFGVFVTAQAAELRMSWRPIELLITDVEIKSYSSLFLEWMREVAIVQAVLWSELLRIRRRSRIWEKQDFEMYEIWSEKERLESKIIPRFRAEETGCIVVFEEIVSVGLWILESCAGSPIRRNSVLAVSCPPSSPPSMSMLDSMLASNAECWRAKMLDSLLASIFKRMNMFILFKNAGQHFYL